MNFTAPARRRLLLCGYPSVGQIMRAARCDLAEQIVVPAVAGHLAANRSATPKPATQSSLTAVEALQIELMHVNGR